MQGPINVVSSSWAPERQQSTPVKISTYDKCIGCGADIDKKHPAGPAVWQTVVGSGLTVNFMTTRDATIQVANYSNDEKYVTVDILNLPEIRQLTGELSVLIGIGADTHVASACSISCLQKGLMEWIEKAVIAPLVLKALTG